MLTWQIPTSVLVATLRSVARTWEYQPYRLAPLLDILNVAQHQWRETDLATKFECLERNILGYHFATSVPRERILSDIRQLLQIFDTTDAPVADSQRSFAIEVDALASLEGGET
jgi:hypothetical protein